MAWTHCAPFSKHILVKGLKVGEWEPVGQLLIPQVKVKRVTIVLNNRSLQPEHISSPIGEDAYRLYCEHVQLIIDGKSALLPIILT